MAKKTNGEGTTPVLEQKTDTKPPNPLNIPELVKNRTLLIVAGALVLAGLGVGGFYFYKQYQDKEAQVLLSPPVFYFEADSLKKALNGDGVNDGVQDVADNYSLTKAGNLADFYTGVTLLKQAKYDEAIEYLKKFSSDDLIIQARAYCLIGDAYSEKKEVREAIKYYKLASEYKPNKFFTPPYLMKLALVQEESKDYAGAIASYNTIAEKYFDSGEAINARKYKARLEAMAGK
jgi:tetratricopeptide (TPR) repeat protein